MFGFLMFRPSLFNSFSLYAMLTDTVRLDTVNLDLCVELSSLGCRSVARMSKHAKGPGVAALRAASTACNSATWLKLKLQDRVS